MDEEILKGKTLLVVDDETDLRDIVASELEFLGAKVFQAENISIAQEILENHHIDLIISDIRMPGGTGIDLLDTIKARNEKAPVILITGFADITIEDAFDKGAEALLNKPFKLDDLIKVVVRYTAPVENRFREPIPAEKFIHPAVDVDQVYFGRGGLAIPIDTKNKKIDIGEGVAFDFTYHDHKISGQGICRWLRSNDQGSGKVLMGLEFMNLDDETRELINQMVQGKKVVPYIPAVKS